MLTRTALSTHERRQRALAAQIAQLESEAIGPKDWTLMGEASARLRPENSLLEEDLDFEHVAKAVPTITEETVATLEELIKRRILDNHFDSPERVRAYEPTAFLPSRFFELNDTKSTQSLAQIYEDEYTATASGGKAPDARDAKLAAEHGEIDRLWGDISYKLDALCSLHFVPRAPAAAITTLENIATTSLETALPATKAATSMLAPHEVFVPTARELTARSEQTPEEAKTARARARRGNKANRAKLETTQKLYGKKRTSVREDKEAALQHLVKSGKGVTVLGKGAKEDGKRRKREEVSVADAKRLKL
jgi:U3 small nucleolar RNA-associated protein MPP10